MSNMDVEHAAPVGLRMIPRQGDLGDAGIVGNQPRSAQLLEGPVVQRGHIGELADIGLDRDGLDAERFYRFSCRREFLFAEVRQRDIHSVLSRFQRKRQADAAGRPGDHCNLAPELPGVFRFCHDSPHLCLVCPKDGSQAA
jgi:hypothetical protein